MARRFWSQNEGGLQEVRGAEQPGSTEERCVLGLSVAYFMTLQVSRIIEHQTVV